MGSPTSEDGRNEDETQHEVTLTRDFEILSTEVTQADFEAVMGYNPSLFSECDDCPVELVNWHEAAAYCNELSDLAGLDRCYNCSGSGLSVVCEPNGSQSSPYDCPGYRLPTEAEWEYAARSGTTDARYGDLDEVAWYGENSGHETQPVGSKAASPWGLYDMLGNVWEFCHDLYVENLGSSAVADPAGPRFGRARGARGGFFGQLTPAPRAASRNGVIPEIRNFGVGFRPARTLP